MYKIIRCDECFSLVIAVTPYDAKPNSNEAKYYRFTTWKIANEKPSVFHEISEKEVWGYFGGIADGLGRGIPPEDDFKTLDDILVYITEKRKILLPNKKMLFSQLAVACEKNNQKDLETTLVYLWKHRNLLSRNRKTVLNIIQCAIIGLELNEQQILLVINSIKETMLSKRCNVTKARRAIRSAGLDPFRLLTARS